MYNSNSQPYDLWSSHFQPFPFEFNPVFIENQQRFTLISEVLNGVAVDVEFEEVNISLQAI